MKLSCSAFGRTFVDTVRMTVYGVDSVEWEHYLDNDALTGCPNNGGYRIFPDKNSYDDPKAEQRKKVWVKAKIKPVMDNKPVYFSWWDVDDPSSDRSPLDDTDYPPLNTGNGGDNHAGPGGLSAGSAVTDGNGIARVTFTVSMCPGDNFKVAVSVNQQDLMAFPWPYGLTQAMVDGKQPLPISVVLSPMLTVWRRLWIEQDSMGQIPVQGDQKNFVEGRAATYEPANQQGYASVNLGLNLPDDFDDENQFRFGRYIAGPYSYPTVASTAYWLLDDKVKVKGNPAGNGAPPKFQLFDDDEAVLPRMPQLGAWTQVFNAAYIEPRIPANNPRPYVAFRRHVSVWSVSWYGECNESRDFPHSLDFWTVLAVGVFQPETKHDFDPDSEAPILGASQVYGGDNSCVLYYETMRDLGKIRQEGKVLAHEIGHCAGIEDNRCQPGCLMWKDEHDVLGDTFCPKCLYRMRNDSDY